MRNSSPTRAPSGLSPSARRWWRTLSGEFLIEDGAGRLLLETALRAFDRQQQAAAAIEADGLVVEDRFGQPRPHPAVVIERDARAAMMAALKALNLDVEPSRAGPGRPGGR